MDHVKEIINTFSEEDIKEFKIFVNRSRKKDTRKDLDLFLLLNEEREYKRDELLKVLYPADNNLEAYHATRKRLIKQLHEFIYIKQIKEDTTLESHIASVISLSKFLFKNKKEHTAWVYLKKAFELAEKSKNYDLLVLICKTGIANSLSEYAFPIEELIERLNHYQDQSREEENARIANFLIRDKIKKYLELGAQIDYNKTIRKVFRDYNISESVEQNPRLLFNIIDVTRRFAMTQKNFTSLEPYIIEKYQKLEEINAFDKYNHEYKVQILYFICHVLYRNKKFKEAELFLESFSSAILSNGEQFVKGFYQKYILLKANIYLYTGRIDDTIACLESSLDNPLSKIDKIQFLNTYIILSIAYFFKEDYNKCLSTFMKIDHTDKWCQKVMGKEWLLKKHLLDVMSQFELHNSDIVEARIRSMQRKYKDLFVRPEYKRVRVFIQLVNKVNNNPLMATSKEFREAVENAFEWNPKQIEDLQVMTFYSWLKSKMLNQKYYDVLLEVVNSRE